MTRGVYFLANDRTLDHALALVNSIRKYDAETPLLMIPYDEQSRRAARVLQQIPRVGVYDDKPRAARLLRRLRLLFGENFFPRPNNFRKQLCWFGPFDEWLYFDADIVVFEHVMEWTRYLEHADFICYSDQHLSGLEHVFKPSIVAANIFEPGIGAQVFNAGMWGAHKGVLSEKQFFEFLAECARDKFHLDRSRGGSDQPVFNYLVLKHVVHRANLFEILPNAPGMWAGRDSFVWRDEQLWDLRVNAPCKFLHWAGFKLQPGAPYWDVWLHFRFLNASLQAPLQLPNPPPPARPRSLALRWLRHYADRAQDYFEQ
jgi:hypothetical protein